MEDDRLTHEWLNAYDALLAGDAKPTLKLLSLIHISEPTRPY